MRVRASSFWSKRRDYLVLSLAGKLTGRLRNILCEPALAAMVFVIEAKALPQSINNIAF